MIRPFTFCLAIASLLLPQLTYSQDAWQQGVDYTISVRLDDRSHLLTGNWELVYTNNSPDTLYELWMHLWPNAYRDRNTAFGRQKNASGDGDFLFAKEEERGYIDGLAFSVGNKVLDLQLQPNNPDIARLRLAEGLLPGTSITLRTPFMVKLPNSFSRLGHVDQQYQITQWYPKPAVYDDEGWHPMPYLDQGEFFSEFGSYEVKITLPKNYVVGATGQLQEQEEIDWLLAKSRDSLPESMDDPFPISAAEEKTLTYRLDSIHDFAWFADKRYSVRHDSMTLASGKQVGLWVLHNQKDREAWADALEYMEDGIRHYSELVGEYPYAMATVVDGALSAGAGMEYPTITVLGGSEPMSLETVIVHELGHNWFYGILGSNEREYPWLDEGLNSYYEMRYFEAKYPGIGLMQQVGEKAEAQPELKALFGLQKPFQARYQLGYQLSHTLGTDQALDIAAGEYSSLNYGLMVYMKTASALRMLEAYWGQERFDRAMQEYYQQWRFNHPDPQDLRASLEKEESLPWLFDGLLGTRQGLDIQVESSRVAGGERVVRVKQLEGVPGPVPVALVQDGEVKALQWVMLSPENPSGEARFLDQDADLVVIDPHGWLPETNQQNNRLRLSGAFRKVEPLQFQPLFSAPQPDKTLINYLPLVGFNANDGFMLGLGLYSSILPEQRLSYGFFPQFATRSVGLRGSYRVSWQPFSELVAGSRVRLVAQGQRYSTAQRHTLKLEIDPMPYRRQNPVYQRIVVAGHNLVLPADSGSAVGFVPLVGATQVAEISHQAWQRTALIDWDNYARGWMSQEALRLENTFQLALNLPNKGRLAFRHYVGWNNNFTGNPLPAMQHLYMDGGRDFLMEGFLWDRRGHSYAAAGGVVQSLDQQGAFKGPITLSSENWLTALNFEIDIPKAFGFGLFADQGWAGGQAEMVYQAGVHYKLLNDWVEFYLPLVGTDVNPEQLLQNFRFTLKLQNLNPYTLLDTRLR